MITESAPLTLDGSFAKSLQLSKLWMCREIKRLMQEKSIKEFNKVYSLGSWYGNMAFFMLKTHVPFKIMVDVDINPKYLEVSKRLLPELLQEGRLVSICGDCNRLRYRCSQPS